MKTISTLFLLTFCLLLNTTIQAQEVKRPITAKVLNEVVPVSPGENMTWVKGHWSWDGTRYVWEKGVYIEKKVGSIWVDGEWERNIKSGWWLFNEGYWKKESDQSDVSNDNNTAEKDKASKEKRQQNKAVGLFIKTGKTE